MQRVVAVDGGGDAVAVGGQVIREERSRRVVLVGEQELDMGPGGVRDAHHISDLEVSRWAAARGLVPWLRAARQGCHPAQGPLSPGSPLSAIRRVRTSVRMTSDGTAVMR